MQAICGFFHLDGAPAGAAEAVRLRAAQIYNPAHNGGRFDGWVQGSVALGSAAWGGKSSGGDDSPVARHPETGCVVVADSRLDERATLAHQLEVPPERHFTQAELILHAWLRWGEDCADKLRGDFAFALWDPRARRLFCARDILGVRPLYVHHQPGKLFAFASRAQALLALPGVPPDLNEGRVADLLVPQLEGIDKTCTFYRAIQHLPPAHAATVGQGHCDIRRYWHIEPGRVALPRSDAGWADALTGVLERAVARHLDGAARLGSMVSGGMDSSSLAVVAADQLAASGHGPLATFSSLDSAGDDPETRAVHAMLRLPGFAPTRIEPATVAAARAEFSQAIWASDEPFDVSMLLTHAQYRAAMHAGVDAVMDGGDGDLLFAKGHTLPRQLRRLHWRGLWRNVRGVQGMYPYLSTSGYLGTLARTAFAPQWARRVRGRLRGASGAAAGRALQASLMAPALAARVDLGGRLARAAAWSAPLPVTDALGEAMQSLDHPYTTCGMERYHRVAAWYGVDPRHPLADRDVLEFCVNLPDRQRMRDGFTKACLREAMRGRLPEPVRTRRDKWHLGWSLTLRTLLADKARIVDALATYRPLLEPYVDPGKLAASMDAWDDPRRAGDKPQVLLVLGLGHWLARRCDDEHRRGTS